MSNVSPLRPTPAVQIAEGFESLAAAIRRGELTPRRAVVVMERSDTGADAVGAQVFGADASVAEIVGALTIAQHHAINGQFNG